MTSYVHAELMQAHGLCLTVGDCKLEAHVCFIGSTLCDATYHMLSSHGNAFRIWRKAMAEKYLKPVWARKVHR